MSPSYILLKDAYTTHTEGEMSKKYYAFYQYVTYTEVGEDVPHLLDLLSSIPLTRIVSLFTSFNV